MRTTCLVLAWTVALPGAPGAQSRAVTGQAGVLGEWELTATVTRQSNGSGGQWTGPLSLKHIGFCSLDGPEEKLGQLRLQLSDPPAQATATLLIDGEACAFSGTFKDGYDGVMRCPDRPVVPMLLLIE